MICVNTVTTVNTVNTVNVICAVYKYTFIHSFINIPRFKKIVTHGTSGRYKGVLVILSVIIDI